MLSCPRRANNTVIEQPSKGAEGKQEQGERLVALQGLVVGGARQGTVLESSTDWQYRGEVK